MIGLKKLIVSGLILFATHAYAGNGDLIVDGKLGVGTTSLDYKLNVAGVSAFKEKLYKTDSSNGAQDPILISAQSEWGYGEVPIITLGFEQGAGGTDMDTAIWSYRRRPDETASKLVVGRGRIDVLGNSYFSGNISVGTTDPQGYKLYVSGPAYSTGGWQGSDVRFKRNVQSIDNSLSKVLGLQGHSYEWKTNEYKEKNFPNGRHYGVIAQEIEKVLPEVVNTDAKGEKSVAYTEIIPVLIEAIKDQQKMIVQQQKQLNELQQLLRK